MRTRGLSAHRQGREEGGAGGEDPGRLMAPHDMCAAWWAPGTVTSGEGVSALADCWAIRELPGPPPGCTGARRIRSLDSDYKAKPKLRTTARDNGLSVPGHVDEKREPQGQIPPQGTCWLTF